MKNIFLLFIIMVAFPLVAYENTTEITTVKEVSDETT